MKRVLIVTYYWPPQGGSGVQRWLKFVKYFREFGWEPVIYTPLNPEMMTSDHSLLKDIPEGVKVLKRKIWEPYTLYKFFTGKRGENVKPGFIANNSSKSSFKEKVSLFIRSNFFVPDPKALWVNPSTRYLKRWLEENRVDAIVTTGPPHSMHIIGERVAKATSIPWIADFRDPWSKMFTFKHMGYSKPIAWLHQKMEREVLLSADRVVTVSDTIAEEFREMLRGVEKQTKKGAEGVGEEVLESKVVVITNGYDPDDFPPREASNNREPRLEEGGETSGKVKENFTITYTGLFMENQNPQQLWRVLGELSKDSSDFANRLQVRLIGNYHPSIVEQIEEAGLKENLIVMGYLPHNQVVEWQREASLLLLAASKEPEAKGILTGKFFEYLAAERPILGFGPTDGDMAIALEECRAGKMFNYQQTGATVKEGMDAVNQDDQQLKEWLKKQFHLFIKGKLVREGGGEESSRYSRRELTREMAKLLDELCF